MSLSLDMQLAVEEMGRAPSISAMRKWPAAWRHSWPLPSEWVEELFWKLQHELNADVLGFGRLFKKEPEAWRRLARTGILTSGTYRLMWSHVPGGCGWPVF